MNRGKKEVFYPKSYGCPVCSQEFSSLKIKVSALKKIRDDTDFCPYYEEVNPIFYDVIVCPICGYAALLEHFSPLEEKEKKLLKEQVAAHWKKKDYTGKRSLTDAIDCYRLALYCSQLRGLGWGAMGALALRLAWLYRNQQEEEKERIFLQHARDSYEKAYTQEDLPIGNLKEDALLYLLGEISRRVKDYDQAIRWFSLQVQLPQEKNRPFIKKRARDQWTLTQKERKK